MSTFILSISCLTTSNIPWFMNVIPRSYAILLFTASALASISSHIHNWVLFLLWLCLFILSGVISPLISSSILGTYQPGSSSFSILSFCLFILFMECSRQEYWRGLPFPSPVDHVFHCIYVPHLFYPFICQWTFSLFLSLGSASEYCSLCEPYSWSYKFATLPQEYKSSQAIHGGMSMLAFQFNFIYEHLNEGHIIYSQNTDLMFTLHNWTGAWVKIS